MSLYTIKQEYIDLITQLEEQGGELVEGQEQLLTIIQENWEEKANQYIKVIKGMQADISFADKEIQRISVYKQTKSNIEVRLKAALLDGLKLFGKKDDKKEIWRYETETFKLGTRSSVSVQIDDQTIADKWKRVSMTNLSIEDEVKILDLLGKSQEELKVTIDILKTPIKDAIEAGELIEGATKVTNYSLNLK